MTSFGGGARPAPQMPTTDGIDYAKAAKWAVGSLADVLGDEKGRS